MPSAKSGSSPASGPDQFELLVRLLKMGSLINNPMKDAVCDPSGISQIELKVLMALAGEGELAGHELVRIMGVPAMNVSRAIAALNAAGLIEATADPDNRRRKPVRLSPAGWGTYEALMPSFEVVSAALLDGLTARQRREFAAIADSIIAAMVRWNLG